MFTSGMPAELLWNTALKFQHFLQREQKETLANFTRLFNAREDVIQIFDDYTKEAYEATYKATKIGGMKTSLSK